MSLSIIPSKCRSEHAFVHTLHEQSLGFLQPACKSHWFSNQLRGLWIAHSPGRISERPMSPSSPMSPPRGMGPNPLTSFPFLPCSMWIDLTSSVVLPSFCQSLVSFQWELLHVEICFRIFMVGGELYIFLLGCLDLLLTTELNTGYLWNSSFKMGTLVQ